MNQPVPTGPETGFTGPELFASSMQHVDDAIHEADGASPLSRTDYLRIAQIHAVNAQTAILVSLVETRGDYPPYEVEAWRDVVPTPPLEECKHKEARRPQCIPTHTEDCAFADPIPEPKHVRIPVGTRVLVSDLVYNDETKKPERTNPQPGRISSHAPNGTYRWQYEHRPGVYASHETFAFMDNRVQIHPDGPVCPPNPAEVKQPPTGPRIYVQNEYGKQGHILEVSPRDAVLKCLIQWYSPGVVPVWKTFDSFSIISADEVERCPNGQTGDECGSGENQCEPCVQADDEEGDEIERSMGLR